jgi:hypothetical protein
MEPYRQKFPARVSIEDWLRLAHPDAPPLPWCGDDGAVACSFMIVPLEETGGVLAVLLDQHGREILRSADTAPILATCLALNPTPWALTFLPAAVPLRPQDLD